MHVFCGSLSFQQALADVCTSNRSRVRAGCVITLVGTPLENERCKKKSTKKWELCSTFGSMRSEKPGTHMGAFFEKVQVTETVQFCENCPRV